MENKEFRYIKDSESEKSKKNIKRIADGVFKVNSLKIKSDEKKPFDQVNRLTQIMLEDRFPETNDDSLREDYAKEYIKVQKEIEEEEDYDEQHQTYLGLLGDFRDNETEMLKEISNVESKQEQALFDKNKERLLIMNLIKDKLDILKKIKALVDQISSLESENNDFPDKKIKFANTIEDFKNKVKELVDKDLKDEKFKGKKLRDLKDEFKKLNKEYRELNDIKYPLNPELN